MAGLVHGAVMSPFGPQRRTILSREEPQETDRAMAILTTARTAAFMPAESPPLVKHARRVLRLPGVGGADPLPSVHANGGGVAAPERCGELGCVDAGRIFSSCCATRSSGFAAIFAVAAWREYGDEEKALASNR